MAPAKKGDIKIEQDKQNDVRASNIIAAKSLADCVRTSLGPRGMDKLIIEPKGSVTISNDGATILSKLSVIHPCAKMLVEISKAQDVEAGDGTTSVVVLCGALLKATETLLSRGLHPSSISESFQRAAKMSEDVLKTMSVPIDINNRDLLIKTAITSLNSKVVSQNSQLLAPMAVDAVKGIINAKGEVNLKNIRLVTAVGGTVDDTELLTNGTIFKQKVSQSAGGPKKIVNATIALVQFHLSPPKTDMEGGITIAGYDQMDRVLKEERKYLLELCKKIKDAGVNVLLVQKSILRDAVTPQSLDFLAKMKIMVVKDIERSDIPFLVNTLGCLPIAHIDNLKKEKFGKADLVAEESTPDGKIVRISGVQHSTTQRTATVFIRGTNQLMVDEAGRSFHDACCAIRSIIKKKAIISGGAAGEIQVNIELSKFARTDAKGTDIFAFREYANAFETIPYTLAENAGLNPIELVTALRNSHLNGLKNYGINVRKGTATDMMEENVIQPLLVSTSAIKLATECVVMILKIDDIVMSR